MTTKEGGLRGSIRNVGVGVSVIPDSVVAQYDARTISGSDGDSITSWSDSVGSFDLSGGSPTLRTSGINGQQSLEFDGTDDDFVNTSLTEAQPTTLFAVVDDDGNLGGDTYGVVNSDTGNHRIYYSSNNWSAFAGDNVLFGSSDDSIQLLAYRYDGNNSVIRENGTQTASGDPGADGIDGFNVGSLTGSSFWPGSIGFVEVHGTGLTDSEISDRESTIASDWGITL